MRLQVRETRNASILDIEGKIDINAAAIIEVTGELLKFGKLNILCNLKDVTEIDYNGLSILAIAYKNVVNHNGKIKFCNVAPHTLSLMQVAHMDNIFEIYDNEKKALRSFAEIISEIERKALRRRFRRLGIHVDVKYSILARPKKIYKGRLINISGAGIYIQTKDTFALKTRLNLKIYLPDFPEPIETSGMVAWIADREIQPHAYPGMGIQFTDISTEDQKKILKFINKNISHRSTSGLDTE